MIILALDTAVTGCAVACLNSETGACETRVVMTERAQAEILVPLIQEVVSASGLSMADIDRIAVTQGPGSFTGVRIGLSTARALGLALDCPVIGFSTLSLLARGTDSAPFTLVLIDTKRNDFYGQIFDGDGEETEPARIWTREHAESFDGDVVWGGMPDVTLMAGLAVGAQTDGDKFLLDAAPQPIYLRNAEVSPAKRPMVRLLVDEKS